VSFLIAGLGNIGEEYAGTRHNIGFDIVDAMAQKASAAFVTDRYAQLASHRLRGRNVYLIKPTTYMNLSGKAVRYWLGTLKIAQQNLLVIVDDVALPFGAIRLRAKGSDGGHNGLKDINAALGNSSYARLRFGIGSSFPKGAQVNFVLGKWNPEETQKLPELIQKSVEAIHCFVTEGLEKAMNKFNS
jgi:PTH1 family peptidyl-tRNA hydrolase